MLQGRLLFRRWPVAITFIIIVSALFIIRQIVVMFSPTSPAGVVVVQPELKHPGEDCWVPCGERPGFCDWCGRGSACCRSLWQVSAPECLDAKHLVSHHFECIVPATKVMALPHSDTLSAHPEPKHHSGEDCWLPCGERVGYCNWCGKGYACCRSLWDGSPSECLGAKHLGSDHFECVVASTQKQRQSVDGDISSERKPSNPSNHASGLGHNDTLPREPLAVEMESPIESALSNPIWEVSVGLYLLNLGKVDLLSGQFDADFYVYFTKPRDRDGPYTLKHGEVEMYFPNGVKGISGYRVLGRLSGHRNETTTQYRVKGSFHFPVDTRDYPFEQYTLEVMFEDPERTVASLGFTPDHSYTGVDKGINFPGFDRDSFQTETEVLHHAYPPFTHSAMTFSLYKFKLILKRPMQSVIIILMPPVFLVLVVSFSSLMPVEHVTALVARITVGSSNLMAAVMYHENMASHAPSTGQFTKADQIMVTIYMLITLNIAIGISLLSLDLGGRKDWAQELHWNTRLLQWILSPISLSVIAVQWYIVFCIILVVAPCVVVGRRVFLGQVHCGISDKSDRSIGHKRAEHAA